MLSWLHTICHYIVKSFRCTPSENRHICINKRAIAETFDELIPCRLPMVSIRSSPLKPFRPHSYTLLRGLEPKSHQPTSILYVFYSFARIYTPESTCYIQKSSEIFQIPTDGIMGYLAMPKNSGARAVLRSVRRRDGGTAESGALRHKELYMAEL